MIIKRLGNYYVDLIYKTQLLFPTCIHIFETEDFESIKDELVEHVYQENNKDPEGRIISNRGGWQSKDFVKDDKILSIIGDIIYGLPVLNEGIDFDIECWFNINCKGDYNNKHVHPNSDFSGVFWLKTPKECGNIVFESPHNFSSGILLAVTIHLMASTPNTQLLELDMSNNAVYQEFFPEWERKNYSGQLFRIPKLYIF